MLGNWATGRARMVREPTSTMTMEITIATMGRLMKNFDIGLFILCLHAKRLGFHLRACTHLLNAFGDDSLARVQPFCNDPLGPNAVANRDRSNAHLFIVTHNRNLVAALELCHRALRNKQRTLLEPNDSANFAITARPQNITRIRKQPGDPNCAGPDIDLAIRKIERALM